MKIPSSGKPSLSSAKAPFDPAGISPFSVIRCSYQFGGEPQPISRRFVYLTHQSGYAVCLKATSKLDAYKNRMAGVVLIRAGTHSCFDRDTIIQPDNPVAIPHLTLISQYPSGEFKIMGVMPDKFPEALARAVRASITMSPREQERILGILDKLGKLGT